jgi:hypothetical protein
VGVFSSISTWIVDYVDDFDIASCIGVIGVWFEKMAGFEVSYPFSVFSSSSSTSRLLKNLSA